MKHSWDCPCSGSQDYCTCKVKEKIAYLERRDYELTCLEGAGVDNWDGCEYAWKEYLKKYPEEDE